MGIARPKEIDAERPAMVFIARRPGVGLRLRRTLKLCTTCRAECCLSPRDRQVQNGINPIADLMPLTSILWNCGLPGKLGSGTVMSDVASTW
jgi:hypothetical protein